MFSLPSREKDLEIERNGARFIVHDRRHDYVHILDERAVAVLRECDGSRSCTDIAKTLAYRSGEPYDQVAGEVAHLVSAFADLALIESATLEF